MGNGASGPKKKYLADPKGGAVAVKKKPKPTRAAEDQQRQTLARILRRKNLYLFSLNVFQKLRRHSARKRARLSICRVLQTRTEQGMMSRCYLALQANRQPKGRTKHNERLMVKISNSLLQRTAMGSLAVAYRRLRAFQARRSNARRLAHNLLRQTENRARRRTMLLWRCWITQRKIKQTAVSLLHTAGERHRMMERYHTLRLTTVLGAGTQRARKRELQSRIAGSLQASISMSIANCFYQKLFRWAKRRHRSKQVGKFLTASHSIHLGRVYWARLRDSAERKVHRRRVLEGMLQSNRRVLVARYYRKLVASSFWRGRTYGMNKQIWDRKQRAIRISEILLRQTNGYLRSRAFSKWGEWLSWRRSHTSTGRVNMSVLRHAAQGALAGAVVRQRQMKAFTALHQFRDRQARRRLVLQTLLRQTERGRMYHAYCQLKRKRDLRSRNRALAEGFLARTDLARLHLGYGKLLRFAKTASQRKKDRRMRERLANTLCQANNRMFLGSYFRKLVEYVPFMRELRAESNVDEMQDQIDNNAQQMEFHLNKMRVMKKTWDSELQRKEKALGSREKQLGQAETDYKILLAKTEAAEEKIQQQKATTEELGAKLDAKETQLLEDRKKMVSMTEFTDQAKTELKVIQSKADYAQNRMKEEEELRRASERRDADNQKRIRGLEARLLESEAHALSMDNRIREYERREDRWQSQIPETGEMEVQTSFNPSEPIPLEEPRFILKGERGGRRALSESDSVNLSKSGSTFVVFLDVPVNTTKPQSIVFYLNKKPQTPINAPPYTLNAAKGGLWIPEPGPFHLMVELWSQADGEGILFGRYHCFLAVICPHRASSADSMGVMDALDASLGFPLPTLRAARTPP